MEHRALLERYFHVTETKDGWALNYKKGRMKPFLTKRIGMVEGGEIGFTIGETLHGDSLGWKKEIRDMIRTAGFAISNEVPTKNAKRKKNPLYPMFVLKNAKASALEKLVKQVLAKIDAELE
jgi:hypothetical protein